jgi:DNA ligase-1
MPKRIDLPIPFQLAATWSPHSSRNLPGWVFSEKLDGVRAMWDGRGSLLSRNGLRLNSPKTFTDSLPKGIVLDGELWIDRGMFEDVVSVIRTRPDDWSLLQFKIFDTYSRSLAQLTYTDRMLECSKLLIDQPSHISIHSVTLLDPTASSIKSHLDQILHLGGEGLVLRDPGAVYSPGRRSSRLSPILKVKPYLDDEAEVLEVNLRSGRRGSIVARDSRGKIFKIGSGFKDIEAEPPPPIGSIISFAYTSRNPSSGKPRFPRYIRQRSDYDFSN